MRNVLKKNGDSPNNTPTGTTTDYVSIYVNKFDEASAKDFFESFRKAREQGQMLVPVYIDSWGGFCDSLIVMMDTILSYEGDVVTIAMGKAMSCGAMLLACGSPGLRFAAPNASIMIHHVASMSYGKLPDQDNDLKESKRLQEQVFSLLSKRCGQRKTYFLDLLKKHGNLDLYLTPNMAKKHKLIDIVGMPNVVQAVEKKLYILL
jgi:ATP-dependent Clp endopeptidase proteolytic subunit ClpP